MGIVSAVTAPTPLLSVVVAALRSGGPVRRLLDEQRDEHLAVMRELTRNRRTASGDDRLVLDYQIFHIEADLRWIDHTVARLSPDQEIQAWTWRSPGL
jgi:hypothetical protein